MKLRTQLEEDFPTQLSRLIGDITGLTGPMKYVMPPRDGPSIYKTRPYTQNLQELLGGQEKVDSLDMIGEQENPDHLDIGVGGKALEKCQSYASALGELAERYCLLWPDESCWIRSTHTELTAGDQRIPLAYLQLRKHYETFHNYTSLTPYKEVIWELGTDLLTGDDVPVPIEFVWFSIPPGYTRSFPSTSNGVAYHSTRRHAVERALYEYVERDAFLRTWYSRTEPRQLRLDNFPKLRRLRRDRFENDYVTYHLFEYETGLDLPVVGCAAVDDRDRTPKFVLGGGADSDYRSAIRDALAEAAQGYLGLERLLTTDRSTADINIESIYNFKDNVTYYANPENFEEVSFLLSGDSIAPMPIEDGGPDPLEAVLARLDEANATPVAFDVTTPDIRELGGTVARVFIPELITLPLPSLPPRNHPALESYEITDRAHPFP